MPKFKVSTEPRIFRCCICDIEVIKYDDTKYDEIVYPNEILCDKHSEYVKHIMDTFQYGPHGKADWEVGNGWRDFIELNKWILKETHIAAVEGEKR